MKQNSLLSINAWPISERRTLEWSAEQRMRMVLIGFLVLGLATSYLGWLADVLAVQDSYGLAVAIAP